MYKWSVKNFDFNSSTGDVTVYKRERGHTGSVVLEYPGMTLPNLILEKIAMLDLVTLLNTDSGSVTRAKYGIRLSRLGTYWIYVVPEKLLREPEIVS